MRTIKTGLQFKNISKTSDTLGAASMASACSGATIASATIASATSDATIARACSGAVIASAFAGVTIATIATSHSQVGTASNDALLALLPQP